MVKTILFGIVIEMLMLSRMSVGNSFTLQTEVHLPVQVLREMQGMQEMQKMQKMHTAAFSIQTGVTGEKRLCPVFYCLL